MDRERLRLSVGVVVPQKNRSMPMRETQKFCVTVTAGSISSGGEAAEDCGAQGCTELAPLEQWWSGVKMVWITQ